MKREGEAEGGGGGHSWNRLFYGDCLENLENLELESVDLVYLDPPFKSDQQYNMLFGTAEGPDEAQVRAFDDTWYWHSGSSESYDKLRERGGIQSDTIEALRQILGPCGMLAYCCFMMERISAIHRAMKPTASLYLHCDPTASHYLKIILDAVMGSNNFRNEVVWRRATAHSDAKRFGRISDRLLFYTASDKYCWNADSVRSPRSAEEMEKAYPLRDDRGQYRSADLTGPSHGQKQGESVVPWRGYDIRSRGRVWSAPKTGSYAEWIEKHVIPDYRGIEGVHDRLDALDKAGLITHPEKGFWPGLKRYAMADLGVAIQDIIYDAVGFTNYSTKGGEYLGYPTQKPLALLERIIKASSCPGDVVLDPFCGCGTAVDAAQALGRRWIGMDISWLAVDVIRARLADVHGPACMKKLEILGVPKDLGAATSLFSRDPLEFERWAVTQVHGKPNDRQTGDQGVDGIIRFPLDKTSSSRGIVSVKGGRQLGPDFVRDLLGTVHTKQAALGLLVTLNSPTRGMTEAANEAGSWQDPLTGHSFPKIQIITIEDLLKGRKPKIPTPMNPYAKATHPGTRNENLL